MKATEKAAIGTESMQVDSTASSHHGDSVVAMVTPTMEPPEVEADENPTGMFLAARHGSSSPPCRK
jgi:hypothetical protein